MSACELSAPTTLPSVVYKKLQEAILNGTFTPGQMLRQDDVAAQLGVSRSPLREALSRLESDGIVVSYPHRGYAVVSLDPKQISEVFDLRCLLETELARRSITLRTAADIAEVYRLAHEMSAMPDCDDADSVAHWYDVHMEFHTALLQPSDCPHHLHALHHSRNLVESYIRTEGRLTGNHEEAQKEHIQLAQAFALGDADQFVELTRHHSQHTRDRLLAHLASQ